jgi:Multimeric flavodoxin WrbA
MKVIGFVASPRKEGSTAFTVNKILEGAEETGAETEIWYSGELDIRPCKGCLCCVKSGKCVVDDDMQKIYDSLKQADALVLGSPVYMGQMTAQAKTFMDRLFAHITPRFSPRFKEENAGKRMILAFTQGNPDPEKFKAYYDYTESMFRMLEFDVKDVIVITDTRNRTASERTDIHESMKKAGSALTAG